MGKLNMDLLKGVEEQENVIGADKNIKKAAKADLEQSKATNGTPAEQPGKDLSNKPQATQTPQKAPKTKQAAKTTPAEKKAEKRANAKPQKQSFSFRAEQDKIENWKLYAETIGAKDIGTLWTAAIDEYIGNHSLTADQQKIFNLKKQAAEMAKGQK